MQKDSLLRQLLNFLQGHQLVFQCLIRADFYLLRCKRQRKKIAVDEIIITLARIFAVIGQSRSACGYGLVDMTGNRLRPVFYGSVLTDKDMLPELRLKKIYDDISDIIDHFKPDLLSIEKLFFNRNVTTAIPVGQARGVVLLAAANKGLPVMEFTPMQIKLSVVGTGSATKEQVIYMVMHLLNIREKIKPDDTADALAAAICGINTASTRRWQEGR